MPVAWWHQVAAVGAPDGAAAYLTALAEAGADAVALFPDPQAPVADTRALARDLIPRLPGR